MVRRTSKRKERARNLPQPPRVAYFLYQRVRDGECLMHQNRGMPPSIYAARQAQYPKGLQRALRCQGAVILRTHLF